MHNSIGLRDTEVILTPLLDAYLKRLDARLAGMPNSERAEIVQEVRAHFADRLHQMQDSAIVDRMGSAEALAARYGEAVRVSNRKSLRRAASLAGATVLLGCAVILAAVFLAELVSPELVGVWRNPDTGGVFVGAASADRPDRLTDLAGAWLMPVSGVLCLLGAAGGWSIVHTVRLARCESTPAFR